MLLTSLYQEPIIELQEDEGICAVLYWRAIF